MHRLVKNVTGPAIGFGCWGMSNAYGPADDKESIATLHEALAMGISHFDIADIYGAGHNEQLLGKALAGRWQNVFIATKFGFIGNEQSQTAIDARPERVKTACEQSLRRLGTEVIDLYYLHRRDKRVAIEDTVFAMAELVREGKVRHLGLSEVSADSLIRASAVHPIAALQSEYSLFTRDPETELLSTCRRLGTVLVAFSPLGRGLLAGNIASREAMKKDDYRLGIPRFSKENIMHNQSLVAAMNRIAQRKEATVAQVALAWLRYQGDHILPIPGMKKSRHLRENVESLAIQLSHGDLASLAALGESVKGPRHNLDNLQFIES